MISDNNIIENFGFLIIEAKNQVKLTRKLLNNFDEGLLEKILSKDDYIDNLKSNIENRCFSRINSFKKLTKEEANAIRSVHIICLNLERIADFCVNISRQMHYLKDSFFIHRFNYESMFSEIQEALSRIISVYEHRDLAGALEICKSEFNLDRLYKINFDRMMNDLKQGRNVEDLITVIFIFRYLERIGDSLLNIGEAFIFAIIGDRIKIRQVDALQQNLIESGFKGKLTDIKFNSFWESRSGCRITKVSNNNAESKTQAVFKEGSLKKIKGEKENIQLWDVIFPGLVPRVFSFHEKQETASLLIESIPGCTLDQIILTEKKEILDNIIFALEHLIGEIWSETKQESPIPTDYMRQLKSRLDAVCRVHPELFRPSNELESLPIISTKDLISRCSEIESRLQAPFSVFIHGDFNTNNIVFNYEKEKICYIDLYRSKRADYVQDASVFFISNFRMRVSEQIFRFRLNGVISHFVPIFSQFAKANEDALYEIRMALALARSFFTSSRFEMNHSFAKDMVLRSHFLMERIIEHEGKKWEDFKLPWDILYY